MISQGLSIWSRYWYNGLGTRVQERFPGPLTNIRRDGIGVTAPVVRTYAGASEVAIKPGISQRGGTTTTYSHPGLKNNEHQSQSASAISASRVYDAWGAVVSGAGAFQGRFGHGGAFGYQSDSTGLQLLGHRYYDPTVGRFLTPDPIKDGRNWYAYCDNNPLNAADSNGLHRNEIYEALVKAGESDLAKRYRDATKDQKAQIHEEVGDNKIGGGNSGGRSGGRGGKNAKKNPDLPIDELIEIVEDILLMDSKEMMQPVYRNPTMGERLGFRPEGQIIRQTPNGGSVLPGRLSPVEIIILGPLPPLVRWPGRVLQRL